MLRRSTTSRSRAVTAAASTLAAIGMVAGATGAAARPVGPAPHGNGSSSSPAPKAWVLMPNTCGVLTTIVKDDTSLVQGVVQGGTGQLVDTTVKLGYVPKAITYLRRQVVGAVTTRQYLATTPAARLQMISVVDTKGADGTVTTTSTQTDIGRNWGGIRAMVSYYPYVYALTDTGGFYRYMVNATGTVSSAGYIATSRWLGVTSIGLGSRWLLGKDAKGVNQYAEDLVAVTRTGALMAYEIPLANPMATRGTVLKPSGWGIFSHVSVGGCATGSARPLIGIKPTGEVFGYIDANGDDQSGVDIKNSNQAATGWMGLIAD